jgi:hypothetical protein
VSDDMVYNFISRSEKYGTSEISLEKVDSRFFHLRYSDGHGRVFKIIIRNDETASTYMGKEDLAKE